jgi:hypothetical protein
VNLTDLFEERSAAAPATVMHHLRMAGVRRKVAAWRRWRLGAGAAAALALTTIALGATSLAGGDQPVPPADAPTHSLPELDLTADQVRIVDPSPGAREELFGVEALLDDDPTTAWHTDTYVNPAFGDLKPGMGILIDLGEAMPVTLVRMELATGGVTAELRGGDDDPGSTSQGDGEIATSYVTIAASYVPLGEPKRDGSGDTTMVFDVSGTDETYRYLMIWITELPPMTYGYRVEVRQVSVVAS